MTAISTFLSLYKQKYQRIGQRQQSNNNNARRSGDELLLDWKRGRLSGTPPSTIDADIIQAVKYQNTVASLNVGLSIFQDIQQKINGSLLDMVESITLFEEREKNLTQTFKVGTKELALRTKAYNGLQTTLKATNDEMARYRANMEANSAFSGKAFKQAIEQDNKYIKRQITAQSYLAKNTDLTDEQIRSLELYSAGSGRALDRQLTATDALAKSLNNGIESSETNESILASIADLSSDIRMQYKGMGGNLEMAVLKAKRLGISMEQLHKTGEGLLNIEKSVGDELQYQLLSGKRLVDTNNNSLLNAYREAVYQGDMTKQAKIMNQILETQADVLNGRNFAAKQQLATTLDMSAKDLMYMKEKKDLQDLINKSGAGGNVDEILNSKAAMKQFKKDIKSSGKLEDPLLLEAITKLEKETENRRSPTERMLAELMSYRQTGLNVKIIDEKSLDAARKAATDYREAIYKPFSGLLQNSGIAKLIGGYNITQHSLDIMENAIKNLSKNIPYFNSLIRQAIVGARDYVKIILGTYNSEKGERNKDTTKPPGGNSKGTHGDAILNINDGVIAKFHPNDKITTVVASPYGAMNERIADKIANPKSNNSSTAQIMQLTAAINKLISTQPAPEQINSKSIVSAIQTAMGNVNITVALDPMAIDKEIKFRSGNLNG